MNVTDSVLGSGQQKWQAFVTFFRAIKFEHSVFALPFAILAAFISSGGLPDGTVFLWVLLAMVGMRTFGMAANRLIDAEIDARNPRTANRAIPAGADRPGGPPDCRPGVRTVARRPARPIAGTCQPVEVPRAGPRVHRASVPGGRAH